MAKKYMWSDKVFEDWCKEQVSNFEKRGLKTSTSNITRILHEQVIKPNKLDLTKALPKPKPIMNLKVEKLRMDGRKKRL